MRTQAVLKVGSFFFHWKCISVTSGLAKQLTTLTVRVRGAEKHEIYAATFGGHLFYDLFVQGQGDMTPSASPWICYWAKITFALCSLSCFFRFVIDSFNPINYLNSVRTRGVLVLLKFYWAPDIEEFVLGRFSHFNIAIAYSNSTFCIAWTQSFCEFTWKLSKFQEYEHIPVKHDWRLLKAFLHVCHTVADTLLYNSYDGWLSS